MLIRLVYPLSLFVTWLYPHTTDETHQPSALSIVVSLICYTSYILISIPTINIININLKASNIITDYTPFIFLYDYSILEEVLISKRVQEYM